MELINESGQLGTAAEKAGMDEKTARKYRRSGKLPSESRSPHTWRTRSDVFSDVWQEVQAALEVNAGLEAKTLFDDLQARYPGRFQDSQLRTLQRRVKVWRAVEGPAKEVFFCQEHKPGELAQSDFTSMNELGITIAGAPFEHLLYHFVLTYSNWEAVTLCFSESFESLSLGVQNALWELGGVPRVHQSDRLSAAVNKVDHPEEFTRAYAALLKHYGLEGRKGQAGKGNENGDVEQRHYRLKRAVDQALRMRNCRDFQTRAEYMEFVEKVVRQRNAGRKSRLDEELPALRRLPLVRLDGTKQFEVRVGPGSTIRVQKNVYSVHSRLIGELVTARLFAERVEVWYAQQLVETLPRLRGCRGHRIDYRHVIDWLVRKPGAFANYRYRQELFPTSWFRMAYDSLVKSAGVQADKEYLRILELAAKDGEALVNNILQSYLLTDQTPSAKKVADYVAYELQPEPIAQPVIPEVELGCYDSLLESQEAVA
jgi:hypothetical protein